MARIDERDVRAVIEVAEDYNLTPHILAANALTNHVDSCDTSGLVSTALLVQIETYLAAHFYAVRDPGLLSETTAGASSSYQRGQVREGLRSTDWGNQAIAMDISGCLAAAADGVANLGMTWLGKEYEDQDDEFTDN